MPCGLAKVATSVVDILDVGGYFCVETGNVKHCMH